MGNTALVALLVTVGTLGQNLSEDQIAKQNTVFQKWWGEDFVWKFEELPLKGAVAEFRVPYSGYIYPDTAGGTAVALQKYDQAFNGSRYPATAHERWDTTAYKESVAVRGRASYGLFGRRFGGGVSYVSRTPYWHGHCNGWTAAAIRHAEPKNSVVRNGVTFTPADIKGLLAELYIYNEMDVIAGDGEWLNAAAFHTILTNWIGRGKHPVAMESDPGKEKWNYPIYAYAASSGSIRNNQVEVKMNIAYAKDSQGEQQVSPRNQAQKYFHYYLNLNDEGQIIGGGFYRDSSRIDMLWIPLQPKAAKQPGNERGNPYIKVEEILAIWRESVPEETRKKWFTIDPANEDRILDAPTDLAHLIPLQEFPVAAPASVPAAGTVAEVAEGLPATEDAVETTPAETTVEAETTTSTTDLPESSAAEAPVTETRNVVGGE